MNNYPVTTGSSYYAGAVVPYTPHAPGAAWEAPPEAIDAYEAPEVVEYRWADRNEINHARRTLMGALNYYAEHQVLGTAWLFTRSTVAGQFSEMIRNMVTGDVLFDPAHIFSALQITSTNKVKSRKHHWQNIFVDNDKDEAQAHRDAKMKLKAVHLWIDCVDEITRNLADNGNAFTLCAYADHLIDGALEALVNSDGDWPKTMIPKYEKSRASLHATMSNNEAARLELYGC